MYNICERRIDRMETINKLERIKNAIDKSESGSVFVASDFANIAANEVVRKNLSLLTKKKIIERIGHGLYIKPQYSKLTNEYLPIDIEKVALAIARNHGWKITPFGQTALNIFGLSNQVPVIFEYLSNGPYRNYEISGYKIIFLHRANKDLSDLPYKTTLIISAIKALGEANITSKDIELIKSKLTDKEKKQILADTKYITRWVREVLKSIMNNELNN